MTTIAKKLKIKKGDNVIVLTGKDKGKKGEVLRVLREENRLVVRGVNVVKKHQRPSAAGAGGIVDKELSIHISNVALADPKTGKATRVGYQVKDGSKIRIARKSGETIDTVSKAG
ncbi:MAG: 50S ribosomal protein L24 [Alphaproteobacteria bacterium]|nr:MAG: 50S ribosomal protein L24 [Alphaproteobacteria bacterium]